MNDRSDRVVDTAVYEHLVSQGVPTKLAAELHVNIFDIKTSVDDLVERLARFGADAAKDADLVLDLETQARYHLPGHVRDLRKAARRLRSHVEKAEAERRESC
jgi:hypothetical protein